MRLPHRPFFTVAIATAAVLVGGALSVVPNAAADASSAGSAASECAPNAAGTTPSVAVQNACGDHAMGGGLPASATASAAGSSAGATATPGATPSATPSATSPGTPSAASNAQAPRASTAAAAASSSNVKGFDISYYQGATTDWSAAVSGGYKFVFIKSTEGTNYVNSYFNSQWAQAGKAGLLRGTYHFAHPAKSSGAAQAQYFYSNGAAMSSTTPGTLPPVIDLETPSASEGECSGLSQASMVSWLSSFMSTLKNLTGRTPIIYTNYSWWYDCTGNNAALASQYPLWMAYYTGSLTSAPAIPSAWKSWTFWQWGGAAAFTGEGDPDVFESSSLATLTSSYGVYPRNAGTDRYATSTSVAQQFVTAAASSTASVKPGQTVYIASGTSFPDALAGGAAAGKAQAPILLVQSNWISGSVTSQLSVLRPKNIVILGGTGVIDTAVQNALAQYTASGSASAVTRIGGTDRYQTSAQIATQYFSAGAANVYVAVGSNWPDALSGSAVAASTGTAGPMLLVQSDSIPSSVASALSALKPQKITIFGGTGVVSPAVASALTQYTASKSASSVVRYGGQDRYATSAQIAQGMFSSGVPAAYAASGANFPDALSAAPLAALAGSAPVLLVPQSTIPSDISSALTSLKPKSIAVIGGSGAVSAGVQAALAKFVVS